LGKSTLLVLAPAFSKKSLPIRGILLSVHFGLVDRSSELSKGNENKMWLRVRGSGSLSDELDRELSRGQ
jgi:hypothetical protein